METQREKIKKYLEDGHSLTPLDALSLFGCFRLATRIFELKKQGMNIRTEMVENPETGKRYAKYRLVRVTEQPVPVPQEQPAFPDDELF